ncbi:MAG: two-component system nitrate/nitrite response regulator NarL [Desulforhopalus sp.]|jgi:two-component system nitrate/nitrite response regulator NarL
MSILVCSHNSSVLSRWSSALQDDWKIIPVASIKELITRMNSGNHSALLLHRSMVDVQQLRGVLESGKIKKVFVLSDRPEDREGLECLRLGCIGYGNTYLAPHKLKAGMEAIDSGLIWVGASLMRKLIRALPASGGNTGGEDEKKDSSLLDSLTTRELQIARLVADGLQNNEIAKEIDVTERTVKGHLSSIYAKTNTKGRLKLALLFAS